MRYSFRDEEFRRKMEEYLADRDSVFEGRLIEGTRESPGVLSELHPDTRKHFLFLSNDSRYSGGDPAFKGRFGYRYGKWIEFGTAGYEWEGELEGQLKMIDNPKFIVIAKDKRVGTFSSKDDVKDYLARNPKVEAKIYEIGNELKPEISIKFA